MSRARRAASARRGTAASDRTDPGPGSAELRALYHAVVLDHAKHPRNLGRLGTRARFAEVDNPLCGDRVTVWAELAGDVLSELAFEASACAVATASASMMTERLKGRPAAEARRLGRAFADFVAPGRRHPRDGALLGALEAFAGVRAFPSRVRCALLPWDALARALDDKSGAG